MWDGTFGMRDRVWCLVGEAECEGVVLHSMPTIQGYKVRLDALGVFGFAETTVSIPEGLVFATQQELWESRARGVLLE